MKFQAVIFDLDDTLYEEFTFVRGGYGAVADHLAKMFSVDRTDLLTEMLSYYQARGREKLFDHVVRKYHWNGKIAVADLLEIYRTHKPVLAFHPDASSVLKRLKQDGIKVGVITDGLKAVQKAKYDSLDLKNWVDCVIFTDDLGSGHSKPSELPFQKMCAALNVDYDQACYVGDNPAKDFLAGNRLKMTTLRVKRGIHKDAIAPSKEHEARYLLNHLEEIFDL